MDYMELLFEHCPVEVAQHVVQNKERAAPRLYWPEPDTAGFDLSDACHLAALGITTEMATTGSFYLWLDALLAEIAQYLTKSDDPTLWAQSEAALRRVLDHPNLSVRFYGALINTKIDIRDRLKERYPDFPALTTTHSMHGFEDRLRLIYLAVLEEPGAFEHIEKEIALIPGPNETIDYLETLEDTGVPGREKIFKQYIEDIRQTTDVYGGRGQVVANKARDFLGLSRHAGPFVLMNDDGQEIEPARTPFDNLRPRKQP